MPAPPLFTYQQFVTDFSEFSDPTKYPASGFYYWYNVAVLLFNQSRWYDLLTTGMELFIAHNLALEVRAQADAANGAPPGMITGVINSKSVDKVSIGYDAAGGIEAGAGHWNLTIYGTRLVRLMIMFGAGPVQIGMGYAPPLNGPAWPGPWTGTFPNMNS
jgi:hypothetical protein